MGKSFIFISGGVRSGKSTFAEHQAQYLAEKNHGELHYIATSRPSDIEMQNRIKRHQEQRRKSGSYWKTWECSLDLCQIAKKFNHKDTVLLDCLTLLITNELFREEESWDKVDYRKRLLNKILQELDMIIEHSNTLIIVSNEVLHEPLADDVLTRTYSQMIGTIHQEIVQKVDKAYLVEAGIPILMKGK